MGTRMDNPPIFYTVGQIRFNPVLEMSEFIGKIQRSLRHKFPDFSEQVLSKIQLQIQPAGTNATADVKTRPTTRWIFGDSPRQSGFILQENSLIYHTTSYITSHEFIEALLEGIALVGDIASLDFIESIGIRTLDAIVPEGSKQLSDLLTAKLHGLYGTLEGDFRQSYSELIVNRGNEQLIARSVILNGGLGMPADLLPIPLRIKDSLQSLNSIHAILDNDCNRQDRFDYDIAEIKTRLLNAKKRVTEVFHLSVTQVAREMWGAREDL